MRKRIGVNARKKAGHERAIAAKAGSPAERPVCVNVHMVYRARQVAFGHLVAAAFV
jgi:hypothetical protein